MPAARPIIVTAWSRPDYEAALTRAGADVRVLQPGTDDPAEALATADGLLLTGGVDVDPARYGEAAHPSVEVDAARDAYESVLAREALDRDLPLLAICRGAQVLNVVAGGSLVQDIPSAAPAALRHTIDTPKTALAHRADVSPTSRLAALLTRDLDAAGTVMVNSRHHQSVKAVAPGFVVTALAPDGVIEAIERPGARFCVGVQWHPENFWRSGEFGGLFEGLVAAATTPRPVAGAARRETSAAGDPHD